MIKRLHGTQKETPRRIETEYDKETASLESSSIVPQRPEYVVHNENDDE